MGIIRQEGRKGWREGSMERRIEGGKEGRKEVRRITEVRFDKLCCNGLSQVVDRWTDGL